MQIKATPQGNNSTHGLECLKLKRLTIPSISEDVEESEFSYTYGRNVKWSKNVGNSMMVS